MKHQPSRRNFLKATTLSGLAFATSSFDLKKYTPLLSFSTLGCPDWSFDKIINFAAANGYNGIEIRGIERQMNLPECPVFSSGKIGDTMKLVKDKGLKIVNLGASAAMHNSD